MGETRLTRLWPEIRAVLVALHLVAITLMALPSVGRDARPASNWKDPTVQAELQGWAGRLERLGWTTEEGELERELRTLASKLNSVRRILVYPFVPYDRYAGARQSWKMFVAPHRYPAELHIEIDLGDGVWSRIYAAKDQQHRWNAELFEHSRMRLAIFMYAWPSYRSAFANFGRWVAAEAARDFPEAKKIQLHYRKARTLSPEEVQAKVASEEYWLSPLIFRLEGFR